MQPVLVGLACQGDDWRTVHVGISHAADKICCARPQRGETHAGFSGQSAVHVGHEGRALLMPGHDEADGRPDQRVEQIHVFLARHTEDVCHTFVLQALYDEFGCFHGCLPDSIFLERINQRCQRM